VNRCHDARPTEIHDVEGFLSYYESVHRRTRAVAERIPADRLEWSPGPGRFTPGDLVRHIAATERWMWAENALGRPSRYPGHGRELAPTLDDVLSLLDASYRETVEIVRGLEPDRLHGRCVTVGGGEITVWKWLRLMIEHEVHHRGQLYEVLAGMGVETPPLYGLTEPQVLERSDPHASVTGS
jgi:uncharacterized damage-inducible protein DinB